MPCLVTSPRYSHNIQETSFIYFTSICHSAVYSLDTICLRFLLAVITNYHQLSALKQHRFLAYNSGCSKSEPELMGPTPRCQQGCAPFWYLQGRTDVLAFSRSQKSPMFPGSQLPFSISKAGHVVFACAFLLGSQLPLTLCFHFPLPLQCYRS